MHLQWVSLEKSPNYISPYLQVSSLSSIISFVLCSTKDMKTGKILDVSRQVKCLKAYPDYKITWARFPLYRDWLLACPTCSDGIMLTDVRDAFFQSGECRRLLITSIEQHIISMRPTITYILRPICGYSSAQTTGPSHAV